MSFIKSVGIAIGVSVIIVIAILTYYYFTLCTGTNHGMC